MPNGILLDETIYYQLDDSNFESNNNNNNIPPNISPEKRKRIVSARRGRRNQLRRNKVSNATRYAINERSRIRNQEARNKAAALAAEVAENQNRFMEAALAVPAEDLPVARNENNAEVNAFFRQFEGMGNAPPRSRKKRKTRKSRR